MVMYVSKQYELWSRKVCITNDNGIMYMYLCTSTIDIIIIQVYHILYSEKVWWGIDFGEFGESSMIHIIHDLPN